MAQDPSRLRHGRGRVLRRHVLPELLGVDVPSRGHPAIRIRLLQQARQGRNDSCAPLRLRRPRLPHPRNGLPPCLERRRRRGRGGRLLLNALSHGWGGDANWELESPKLPVVISFPGTELKSRDVVVGLEIDGASRPYPWDTLVKQSPVVDHVHGTPLLVAVGPDGKSFRVFISRIDGKDAEFFLKGESEGQ